MKVLKINDFIKELLKAYRMEKISDTEKDIWSEVLRSLDYPRAMKALKSLRSEITPTDTFGRLPEAKSLLDWYQGINRKKYCPCCTGIGWIYFEKLDKSVRCDCSSPEIEISGKNTIHAFTLSQIFPDNPQAKCDAFRCAPTRKHPCPLGILFYNAKKVEWMNRIKATIQPIKGA